MTELPASWPIPAGTCAPNENSRNVSRNTLALGREVCLRVPLQRVDGAVGAEEGRRFSWLG